MDNLVLIGAPINKSLLDAVKHQPKIKNVIIMSLKQYGDPIYAGMSDIEIIESVPKLAEQMTNGKGTGHFYYAAETEQGAKRRSILAQKLYQMGLR